MTRRWSLRTRFVAAASLCLLPLLGVVLFVLDQSLEHSREQLLDTEDAVAAVVAQNISRTLTENQTVLDDLATSEPFRDLAATPAQERLNQLIRNRPTVLGAFLVDAEKGVVAFGGSVDPRIVSGYYTDALNVALVDGEAGVSDKMPVPDSETGAEVISLIVPVRPEDDTTGEGSPIGAVGAFLSVEQLGSSVTPAFQVAASNTTIAVISEAGDLVVAQRRDETEAQILAQDLAEPIELAVAGERGRQSYEDPNGAERLAVFAPIEFEPAKWAVVVTSPSPTTYGPNQSLLERGLIALVAAVVLTLVLAVIFGELTARPLRQLTGQATAISSGDLDQPMQPVGRGEIATLSTAFRDMAGRLTTQVRDLEGARAEVEVQAERLRDLLRRTVRLQEDERRRIASEIHDAVSPLITGALYQARAIRLSAGGNGHHGHPGSTDDASANGAGAQEEALGAVTELLERAMAELHDVVFALRPPDLDDLGVVAAIERYVGQIVRNGLPCRLDVLGEERRLSPEARLAIYRIVQEALHNSLRHADADEAVVRMEWTDDLLRVTIRDNGSGFDPDQTARPTALGLLSMRERAAAIGASLEIASRPGGGTAVIIERRLDSDLDLRPLVEPEIEAMAPRSDGASQSEQTEHAVRVVEPVEVRRA
ncbi:MAG: sensor histidine kinase [Thermomicrobiales bacterium]